MAIMLQAANAGRPFMPDPHESLSMPTNCRTEFCFAVANRPIKTPHHAAFFCIRQDSEHFALPGGALPFFQLAAGGGDALRGGALPPLFGFYQAFFDAEAFAVEVAELVLCLRVGLAAPLFVPLRGAAVVLRNALAVSYITPSWYCASALPCLAACSKLAAACCAA